MTKTICVLGRQPALGLAELESLYGADAVTPIGSHAAMVDVDPSEIRLERLGGSLKTCKLLAELPYTDWHELTSYITSALPEHLPYVPEGKIRFGLSLYGLSIPLKDINRSGLSIKRSIRDFGRSVRVVPNKEPALSTAQTIHNQLTGYTGMELVLIADKGRTWLAQVTDVQNIEAYAARDQARPKRDARVGMLPPKLAQIIINLATGPLVSTEASDTAAHQDNQQADSAKTILDPFCGTGVILQEALLMGHHVCGTDLEPRMVDYSQGNLDWLRQEHPEIDGLAAINQGDATNHEWPSAISAVAAETYLGRPLSSLPERAVLNEVMRDVDTIHKKFLKNLATQTKSGFRLCIAVPAWKTKSGFLHLRTLDSLGDLGYTRASFAHVSDDDLVYHRPGQIVARELVVLTRK